MLWPSCPHKNFKTQDTQNLSNSRDFTIVCKWFTILPVFSNTLFRFLKSGNWVSPMSRRTAQMDADRHTQNYLFPFRFLDNFTSSFSCFPSVSHRKPQLYSQEHVQNANFQTNHSCLIGQMQQAHDQFQTPTEGFSECEDYIFNWLY